MCIVNVQTCAIKPHGNGAMLQIGHAPQLWLYVSSDKWTVHALSVTDVLAIDSKYTGTVLHCAVLGLVTLSLAPP